MMKTCTKCGEAKSEEEFSEMNGGLYRRNACKPCLAAYRKAHYPANKERTALTSKSWVKNNREKTRGYQRKWESRYGKEYRKRNPQRIGTTRAVKESSLAPQDLFCGLSRVKVNAEVRFDYILRDLLIAKTGIQYHVDHIKPLCAGGVHRVWNLAVITAAANEAKGSTY
jgi:hypothetical protein